MRSPESVPAAGAPGTAYRSVAVVAAVALLARAERDSTELQISDVFHVERIHVVADRHADMTGITAQILAGDHSSAAKGESVGGTQAYQQSRQSSSDETT